MFSEQNKNGTTGFGKYSIIKKKKEVKIKKQNFIAFKNMVKISCSLFHEPHTLF